MTAIAILLGALLVLVLVGSRMSFRLRGNTLPATVPTSGSFSCALPVITTTMAGNPYQEPVMKVSPGFVNIPAGDFWVDPAAALHDLPSDKSGLSATYSSQLKRWLPADSRTVSPDGRSYVYVRWLPEDVTFPSATSYELHVVDAAKKSDRMLWSTNDSISIDRWDSRGILVDTTPKGGGRLTLWRLDPAGGRPTQTTLDPDPSLLPFGALPQGGSYGYLGDDKHGRSVFRIGSRDPGTTYSVVVVESGQATTIYSGVAGDATDFDPGGVYSDTHGLWLGNDDGSRVWLWTRSAGLRSFKVTGLPPAPSGYGYSSLSLGPAGECVPGEFRGVAAAPLARPSPSPTPAPVDWTPLLARPLNLQDLPAGSACPVTPQVTLSGKVKAGKGPPGYGYGKGPVYLSGQITWYSGSQGLIIVTDSTYSGPVLVRGRRLNGAGSVSITGTAESLAGGATGIRETSSPGYWGVWFGAIEMSAPGCYAIQFDGTTFSTVVIIQVEQGPPPPG